MRKISLALVAASLVAVSALAVSAMPAAASGQKSEAGLSNSQTASVNLSARRYHRGYRPYYRPAPFPFFPFFF